MIQSNYLSDMNNQQLLILYSNVMEELRNRDIIRSGNNPVADYAEKVAVEKLKLNRAGKEAKGFDASDNLGNYYQIKGRRITKYNNSRQLGVIRNLDDKLFNYLIAVFFYEDFTVKEIWKIPHSFIKANSTFSSLQNGYILIANNNILSSGIGVERIQ